MGQIKQKKMRYNGSNSNHTMSNNNKNNTSSLKIPILHKSFFISMLVLIIFNIINLHRVFLNGSNNSNENHYNLIDIFIKNTKKDEEREKKQHKIFLSTISNNNEKLLNELRDNIE